MLFILPSFDGSSGPLQSFTVQVSIGKLPATSDTMFFYFEEVKQGMKLVGLMIDVILINSKKQSFAQLGSDTHTPNGILIGIYKARQLQTDHIDEYQQISMKLIIVISLFALIALGDSVPIGDSYGPVEQGLPDLDNKGNQDTGAETDLDTDVQANADTDPDTETGVGDGLPTNAVEIANTDTDQGETYYDYN